MVWNVTDFFFGLGGGSGTVADGVSEVLGLDEIGSAFSLVTEELVMAVPLLDGDWDGSFEADALFIDEPMADSEDGFISKLFPVDDADVTDVVFSLLLTLLASTTFGGHSSSPFLALGRFSIVEVSVLFS